jgi:hypothetical protein
LASVPGQMIFLLPSTRICALFLYICCYVCILHFTSPNPLCWSFLGWFCCLFPALHARSKLRIFPSLIFASTLLVVFWDEIYPVCISNVSES